MIQSTIPPNILELLSNYDLELSIVVDPDPESNPKYQIIYWNTFVAEIYTNDPKECYWQTAILPADEWPSHPPNTPVETVIVDAIHLVVKTIDFVRTQIEENKTKYDK